jgi:hypothetical protein
MGHLGNTNGKKRWTRQRRKFSFTISSESRRTLDTLAARFSMPLSRVLDKLLAADFATVFELFRKKIAFADVVIRTGLPPSIVRELFAEYSAGYRAIEAPRLEKEIELERIRLARAEVVAADRERRALIQKSARLIEADASVRVARFRARGAS